MLKVAQFSPDILVYIETGGRLLACELCRGLGIRAIAVTARRSGHGFKHVLSPLVAKLPSWFTSILRRVEERSGIHRKTNRTVEIPLNLSLTGKTILLVDDAADTGRTIEVVRQKLVERGAASERIRTVVLAATTPAARAHVDFFLFEVNCRLPWSADSSERVAARQAYLASCPPEAK